MALNGFRVNLVKEVKKERDEIRKDTKKCKKEKPQVPLSSSLLLSDTQELTGEPLRGKMAAEGRKRLTHLPLSDEANTLFSTPLKEDLGCSSYLSTFLGVAKEELEQVYSELEIPIHVSEVQVNFNAFELVKLEPIKLVLDSDIDMPMHTHVVDSLLPTEHIYIPDVHYPCIDPDLYDSPKDVAYDLEIGNKIFNEQKQIYSEPEIPITLPYLPIHSNACDLRHTDSIGLELTFDYVDDVFVNIDFEVETVQSDNFIELGLNFDLTQFSENFECDCESGSCSIYTEIDSVLQPDSKLITDAINSEFDDQAVELNENAGVIIKEFMVDEGECTATTLSEPKKEETSCFG
ncbi:hypothetical protein LR48_Vigan07g135300 [Vigna angularis]|uniref:Uncharacterized protein n=1 Tax=Phaseolus angularis TaxID=3914 RepID=A0A0L9UYM6_PHAAN|nr:hypothetical protein LR48_Vigan07g135300 [Vigna angularis]